MHSRVRDFSLEGRPGKPSSRLELGTTGAPADEPLDRARRSGMVATHGPETGFPGT
ncbi:hypothetical protein [Streptomyces sp. WAC00263]|uniref:hypothetical protein n=1 Tax=Streptomyces sp. WAC00263 TaxID=1917422 RepID=UPI0015EF0A96|nr:hypothetical protein [Streptomyces sp. WAC00263]